MPETSAPLLATLGLAWNWARRNVDAADARVLLRETTGCPNGAWISHPEQPLSDAQQAQLRTWVTARQHGTPVAHLLGWREFYGHRFVISADVLIPRPDTETLVDAALRLLPAELPARVLDLGTGSGCIAVSLALARPHWRVTATDVSSAALAVAEHNVQRLGAGNVRCLHGNWYAPVSGCFDLIVSNPPYIAADDPHLQAGDLRFEPATALTPGGDGLDALRAVAAGALAHLQPGGWLLVEHGWDQAATVAVVLAQAGLKNVLTWRDLGGHVRVSGGRFPGGAEVAAASASG